MQTTDVYTSRGRRLVAVMPVKVSLEKRYIAGSEIVKVESERWLEGWLA